MSLLAAKTVTRKKRAPELDFFEEEITAGEFSKHPTVK
jgi:hypothetical protein